MAGIMTALGTASLVVKTVLGSDSKDVKDLSKEIYGTLNSKQSQLIKTDGSITKLLGKFIVEPVLIVSKDTMHIEEVDKMIDTQVDIFSSYYMQAFSILSTIYKLDKDVIVDLLGTDNGSVKRVIKKGIDTLAKEEYTDINYLDELLSNESIVISSEASGYSKTAVSVKQNKDDEGTLRSMLTRNLEVSIPIQVNGKHSHTMIIPITVKAHVIFTDINNIINMLKPNAADKSFSYRLDEYKSGGISLLDLVFANDIIDEYKDNKIKDKDQLLNIINERTASANSKAFDHGGVAGYEKYYNMLIVSANDKIRLDKHVNGDFFKEKYKQKLLEQGRAMTVTVMDEDYERAVVLTKDIRGKSDVSFRSLSKRKDGKVDLGEMMKAMMSNRPPVL